MRNGRWLVVVAAVVVVVRLGDGGVVAAALLVPIHIQFVEEEARSWKDAMVAGRKCCFAQCLLPWVVYEEGLLVLAVVLLINTRVVIHCQVVVARC